MESYMGFPINVGNFRPLELGLESEIPYESLAVLQENIQIMRDVVITLTAVARAKGLGGHTGGPYDIVPEVLIIDALRDGGASIHDGFFDEAGHRSALQYARAALNGKLPIEKLLQYREHASGLAGHPECDLLDCVDFSTGRLGHAAGHVNGVAMANPKKAIIMFGSDGSQMEGNDAEAARFAVAHNLNVKWIIDDNNVTISGHPESYMEGFELSKTLEGQGFKVLVCRGENTVKLYKTLVEALKCDGPVAVVCKRVMGRDIPQLEGTTKLHDVIPIDTAKEYLTLRGHTKAIELLDALVADTAKEEKNGFLGSSDEFGACRVQFGKSVVSILDSLKPKQRKNVHAFDSDLEGSVGLNFIRENHPDCFTSGGVQERNNFLAAAGFGSEEGKQGIFATFSAFMEMVISEITMSRLNHANVLSHFSHAGVDDMSDNTCHFGLNNFFADNFVEEDEHTRLYFPGDVSQMDAVVKSVFNDPGLRFIFSTRSKVPKILNEKGGEMFGKGYQFEVGKDEIIREGDDGWIVTFGDMLYRSLHAVEILKKEGISIGLMNKPTLNVIDEKMISKVGNSDFVMVVESLNSKTGLGIRYGTWLLERGFTPKYSHMGTSKPGIGGQKEQIGYQGLSSEDIVERIKKELS